MVTNIQIIIWKIICNKCNHSQLCQPLVQWVQGPLPQDMKQEREESHNRPSVDHRVPGGLGSQIFMTFGT